MNPSTIRIAIVDDQPQSRAALGDALCDQVGLLLVGETGGTEAIALVGSTPIHVLILAVAAGGSGGLDTLLAIRAQAPGVGVLVLSDAADGADALALLRNGASAYLRTDCDRAEIVAAIRMLALGRRYITQGMAQMLAQPGGEAQLSGG